MHCLHDDGLHPALAYVTVHWDALFFFFLFPFFPYLPVVLAFKFFSCANLVILCRNYWLILLHFWM